MARRYAGQLDADADTFIAYAVDGATRMQRLIEDLLAYSRVGTTAQAPVPVSSETAVIQALRDLDGAITCSAAQVTHDPLPVVLADGSQLVQLFVNLIGNAIKYHGPRPPAIHVSATLDDDGDWWRFAVSDHGMGIEPAHFERIFGMFQRLHGRDEFGGTGIGLAICRKIVERHGGTIDVESQPGLGSTFRFTLPADRTMA